MDFQDTTKNKGIKGFVEKAFILFSVGDEVNCPRKDCDDLQALMCIKAALKDPHGVLAKWDSDAADPCS
ncbi:hypothetical protein AgCh_022928 [Apium graveolens]